MRPREGCLAIGVVSRVVEIRSNSRSVPLESEPPGAILIQPTMSSIQNLLREAAHVAHVPQNYIAHSVGEFTL